MDLRESVESWIRWSRDNLPGAGDIPAINWRGVGRPWETCAIYLFDRADDESHGNEHGLLRLFEALLAPDPSDLATRFTALSVYFELSRFQSIYDEDFVKEHRLRHKSNLEYLVHLVCHEDCSDWRIIRWEILNSYAIRDWKRTTSLYNRAEDSGMLARAEIQALRGQYEFLAAVGDNTDHPLDSLFWEPRIYNQQDLQALFLADEALDVPPSFEEKELRNDALEFSKDAANDFDKALAGDHNFGLTYRVVNAACLFLALRYFEAAREYEQLVNEHLPSVLPEYAKEFAYYSTVISYRRAEQTEKALEVCKLWGDEFPKTTLSLRLKGELLVDLTRYDEACKCYRKLIDLDPKFEQEPGIRASIALHGLSEIAETEKAKLKEMPEYQLASSLLENYWRPFARMSQSAKEEWVLATLLRLQWSSDSSPLKIRGPAKADLSYATAVELELARKVFKPYRDFALENKEVRELATQVSKEDKELQVIAAISLRKTKFDKQSPTLGQMAFIIDNAQKKQSKHALWKVVHDWLAANYPSLFGLTSKLWELNEFRNKPAHGILPDSPPQGIPDVARVIIESLFPSTEQQSRNESV